MADQQFRIDIISTADNAGFQSAANASEDLSKSMGVVNVSSGEVKKVLGEAGEKAEEAGEHMEKAEGHGREMHKIFGELERIVPGAGEALKAAFNPKEVGLIGMVVVLELVSQLVEAYKKDLETMPTAFEGQAKALDDCREAYDKVIESAEVYARQLFIESAAGQTAAQVAEARIKSYESAASAQEKLNQAQKNFAAAGIDAAEEAGTISHAQALEKKFALDVEYAQKKVALDAALSAQELKARQDELATQTQQRDAEIAHTARHGDLTVAAANASAAAEKNKTATTIDEANLKAAQDNVAKGSNDGTAEKFQQVEDLFAKYYGKENQNQNIATKIDKLVDAYYHGSKVGGVSKADLFSIFDISSFHRNAVTSFGGDQDLIAKLTPLIRDEKAKQGDLATASEEAKKDLEAARTNAMELTKSVNELQVTIKAMAADNAAKNQNAAAVANLDLRTGAVKAGLPDPGNVVAPPTGPSAPPSTPPAVAAAAAKSEATHDVNELQAYYNVLEGGGKIDSQHTEMLSRIASMVAGHAVTADTLLAFMKENVATTLEKNAAISREVAALTRQVQEQARSH